MLSFPSAVAVNPGLEIAKGTVSVILWDSTFNDSNARFTKVPTKPNFFITNVEDNVVFLTRKVLISVNFVIVSYKQELRRSLMQRI